MSKLGGCIPYWLQEDIAFRSKLQCKVKAYPVGGSYAAYAKGVSNRRE